MPYLAPRMPRPLVIDGDEVAKVDETDQAVIDLTARNLRYLSKVQKWIDGYAAWVKYRGLGRLPGGRPVKP